MTLPKIGADRTMPTVIGACARPVALALTLLLSGCDFAPDYHPPALLETTAAFKETGDWKLASPADDIPRGAWWQSFGDPRLNQLEEQLGAGNQTLRQALALHDQTVAAAAAAGTAQYPQIDYDADGQRAQKSRTVAVVTHPNLANDFYGALSFSWEVDLWGRVRNLVAAANLRAQASSADLAAVKLALEVELAETYLLLQSLDAQQDLLDHTVKDNEAALAYTVNRYHGGAAAQIDVDAARAQLATTRTQTTNNQLLRAQQEHAIALLIGRAPVNFSLPPQPRTVPPPAIAVSLPSALLERRPDIAAAERRVAAANADIGMARAAYFPVFDLAALGGVESALPHTLLNTASTVWAFGPTASGALFDAGQRDANVDLAQAAFAQAVAAYRQTVLTAYREVEDNLVALRRLEEETLTQDTAVQATTRVLDQATLRYQGGIATYLEVITAQNAALAAQSTAIDIHTRQIVAATQLIKALGGGWEGFAQTTSP